MPRTPKHEIELTRARIVAAASQRFRAQGYGASIVDIMADVGKTNGAFYRYFASTEHLIISSLEHEFAHSPEIESLETLIAILLGTPSQQILSRGCSAAVLTPDVSRQGTAVKHMFLEELERRLAVVARSLDGSAAEKRGTAMALISMLLGSLHLARAVGDDTVSEELLRSGARAAQAIAQQSGF